MKECRYMKPLEAMSALGIARTTLAAYVRFGKIRVKKIKDNRYEYHDEDVQVLKEMQEYSKKKDETYFTNIIVAHSQEKCDEIKKICDESELIASEQFVFEDNLKELLEQVMLRNIMVLIVDDLSIFGKSKKERSLIIEICKMRQCKVLLLERGELVNV